MTNTYTIFAWKCTAVSGWLDPEPCIVFAQRRAQAKQVARSHGLGFDQVDYVHIRCCRAPEHDGEGVEGSCGMYDQEDGSWFPASFRRYGNK